MPRLFVALKVPESLAFQLSLLSGGIIGARWIDHDRYHITLRFIGDVDNHIRNEVINQLAQISFEPFEIKIDSLSAFGGNKPHSLISLIKNSDEINHLQKKIEVKLQKIGLKPDGRKFTPHITLARLRGVSPFEVSSFINSRDLPAIYSYNVDKFHLLSSKPNIGGGPYINECDFFCNQVNFTFSDETLTSLNDEFGEHEFEEDEYASY